MILKASSESLICPWTPSCTSLIEILLGIVRVVWLSFLFSSVGGGDSLCLKIIIHYYMHSQLVNTL